MLQEGASVVVFHGDQSRFVGEKPTGQIEEYQVPYPVNAPRQLRGLVNALRFRSALNRELVRQQPDILISVAHLPLAVASGAALRRCKLVMAAVFDVMPISGNGRIEDMLHKRFWRRMKRCRLAWASDPGKAIETCIRTNGFTQTQVCFNSPPLAFADKLRHLSLGSLSKASGISENALRESTSVMVRAGAIGLDSVLEETILAMREMPSDAILLALGQPEQSYRERLLATARRCGVERRVSIISMPTEEVWCQALAAADIGHMLLKIPEKGYLREKWQLNGPVSQNRLFQYLAAGLPVLASEDLRLREFSGECQWLHIVGERWHTPSTIAREWKRIAESPVIRSAASAEGLARFRAELNWEQQFHPVLKRISQSLVGAR